MHVYFHRRTIASLRLDARVVLLRGGKHACASVPREERVPVLAPATCLVERLRPAEPRRDFFLALDNLHRHASAGVPSDVAVQEPGAGVVGFVGEDEVAAVGEHGGVAARGVVKVVGGVAGVEWGVAGGDDGEVVAVEVDGVGSLEKREC